MALDPGFALAWAKLSIRRSWNHTSPEEGEAARKAAERALELAPSMPEAYRALGVYYNRVRHDPEKALEAFARGLSLAPDDAGLLLGLGRHRATARPVGRRARAPASGAGAGPSLVGGANAARGHSAPAATHRRGARGDRPWPRPRPGAPQPDPPEGDDLSPGGGPRGGTGGVGRGTERGGAYGPRGRLRQWRPLLGARRRAARRVAAPDAGGVRRRPRGLGARPRAGVGAAWGPGEGPRVRRGGEKGLHRAGAGGPGRAARCLPGPGARLPGPQGRGDPRGRAEAWRSGRSRGSLSRARTSSTRPCGSTSCSGTTSGRWTCWSRC